MYYTCTCIFAPFILRDTVYKYGIRTTEFFTDFDKLRSGLVTENQFVCGFSLLLAKRGHVTREELGYIVRHYSTTDGHVNYRKFCHEMENGELHVHVHNKNDLILEVLVCTCECIFFSSLAYNKSDFEKNPTDFVYRPPRGHLQKVKWFYNLAVYCIYMFSLLHFSFY